MFDDLTSEISLLSQKVKQKIKDVEYTKAFLSEVEQIQSDVLDLQERIEKIYSTAISDSSIQKIVYSILNEVKESASDVLLENTRTAIESSTEFSRTIYAVNLLDAVKDKYALNINVTDYSWGSKLEIENNLDEVAGSLEDWGNAVKKVRELINSKEKDPIKLSQAWARLFESGAENWEATIELRILASGKLAPFWSILENGQAHVTMSSDIGGYPTPSSPPKRFVQKTILGLEKLFNNRKRTAKREHDLFVNKIRKLQNQNIKVLQQVKTLFADVDEVINRGFEQDLDITANIEIVESHYSNVMRFADRTKLRQLITELTTVGESVSFNVTAEGRIDITRGGAGGRARVSISKILALIGE